MDPQWNMFQPPNSEPAILDYNHRSINSMQHAPPKTSHYNYYENSNISCPPPPTPPAHFNYRAPQPTPPCFNTQQPMFNPNQPAPAQHTMPQGPPRSPQMPQSNYYCNTMSQYKQPPVSHPPPRPQQPPPQAPPAAQQNSIQDFHIGTFTLNANGYPNEGNGQDSNNFNSNTNTTNDIFSQANGSSSNNSNYSQTNGSYNNSSSSSSQNNSSSANNSQNVRETGIIEKLLQTYGFIQCCERQARLFFHFSQFDGNTDHLRIGDPVEFEVTFDRRTGKPIASTVAKISPEVVLSEERVIGIVTTELRSETGGEQQGRITYENRGECFFLPYCKEDVEGYVVLKPGDQVSFQIATNQRTGNLAARHVRRENPAKPVKYQGVVSTIKDSYGFIERADVVDEIFFHFSEAKNIPGGLKLGDDVEFLIQSRNSKEVATNIEKLDYGTVVFEDTSSELLRGQVLKPVEKGIWTENVPKEPLPGRIRYRGKDRSEVEVKFGERDQVGEFTLRHGDWVQFNIATDRRDHLQKATNISLVDDSFNVSGEKREVGMILSFRGEMGLIKSYEKDVMFHANEMLDPNTEINIHDEVEFTVASDKTALFPPRTCATRIRRLPEGTVKFEELRQEGLRGKITIAATGVPASPGTVIRTSIASFTDERQEPGQITYYSNPKTKQTVNFFAADCETLFQVGDKVKFNLYQLKRSKEYVAMNLKIIKKVQNTVTKLMETTKMFSPQPVQTNGKYEPNKEYGNGNNNGGDNNNGASNGKIANGVVNGSGNGNDNGDVQQGYVAALKESFGFIETQTHEWEIFFHFSNVEGDAGNFELGQEVEYTLSSQAGPGGKFSAENVRALPVGSLYKPKILPDIYEGVVIRSIRSINPDQSQYCGLVAVGTEDKREGEYQFGITGLVNKRELIQSGDQVTFQLDEDKWAVNIKAIRKKLIATVEAVKAQYGFLNYETEEGKKLFFHQSEVKDGVTLSQGDEVEFVIITNQKTKRSSACNISRLLASSNGKKAPKQRPNRLVLKVRGSEGTNTRMPVVRQPKGPDGTKGFKLERFLNSTPMVPPPVPTC